MPEITRGTCHVLFAYDIGFSVDLNKAQQRIKDVKQRETIKHKRRAPQYFQYQPAPLRVTHGVQSLAVGEFHTNPAVDVVLYDFGGASVVYSIPLSGSLLDLLTLSETLYENLLLLNDSRKRVEEIVRAMGEAVSKPSTSTFVEDYVIFQIDGLSPQTSVTELVTTHRQRLAQILRA